MIPGKVYDLGQPYFAGMPHFPTHPPFLMTLNKLHGELVASNGASSASETVTLGGHVGTHIDALAHFSCDGKLHGGVAPTQSYSGGRSMPWIRSPRSCAAPCCSTSPD